MGAQVPWGAASTGLEVAPSGDFAYETIAGRCHGQSELFRDGGRCARGGNVPFNTRDAAVRLQMERGVPVLIAPVALNGFFAADSGASVILGRFTPYRLDFDAGTLQGGYRCTFKKN